MAAKMPCPTCKKQISMEADACPKCGQPITAADREHAAKTAKRVRMGCLWIVGIFFAIILLGKIGGNDETTAPQAPAPVQAAKSFDFNLETFLSRFNAFAASSGGHSLSGPFKKQSGSAKDTMQIMYSDAAGFILAFDKATGRISEITMLSAGAKGATALDPIVCMGGVIAVACPHLDANGRGQVLRDMDFFIDTGATLPEKAETARGNVRFWAMTSEHIGFLFGAASQ